MSSSSPVMPLFGSVWACAPAYGIGPHKWQGRTAAIGLLHNLEGVAAAAHLCTTPFLWQKARKSARHSEISAASFSLMCFCTAGAEHVTPAIMRCFLQGSLTVTGQVRLCNQQSACSATGHSWGVS